MKSIARLFLLTSSLFSTGCHDEFADSQVIDFGPFQVQAPSHWKEFSSVGFDSQVGGLTNKKDTLKYDYGWYSYNFSNETTATHIRTETRVNGRDALIVKPKEKGKGLIGIFIEVNEQHKLSIYGTSKEEKTILRILESVKFE